MSFPAVFRIYFQAATTTKSLFSECVNAFCLHLPRTGPHTHTHIHSFIFDCTDFALFLRGWHESLANNATKNHEVSCRFNFFLLILYFLFLFLLLLLFGFYHYTHPYSCSRINTNAGTYEEYN